MKPIHSLKVVEVAAPTAVGSQHFPTEHVVFGAGPQARFIAALREAPVTFSVEELGWAVPPKAPIAVKLANAKDLDWHLEPEELEP